MKRLGVSLALAAALAGAPRQPAAITVDFPEQGSIFPPEITPPAFLWRDPVEDAAVWRIEIKFAGGLAPIRAQSRGERLPIGEIDPRAVAETNQPPQWNPQIAAARSWTPDTETWEAIKKRSGKRPATITIPGYREEKSKQAVSRGQAAFQTSPDPVGAPIFYRDVPLMPSETEKGVIKPLAAAAVPLIGWRLRDVGEPKSRLLLEGLPTCANCHSFSRDGKTLGMDLDGPGNDKGMYAIVPLAPKTTIRNEDVINWGSFRGKLGADLRVGFMSQVSPDGRHVVTMIDRPDAAAAERARAGRGHFYVANFKDYRFLQVFYPTRGILAWYSRATGRLEPLPGADDPRYVHTNAVWSPDGNYLVFARAQARAPYPEGRRLAEFANDPNETPIQYDLYRIPFNDGKGGR
ncbi:MAG: PD40 domain-containing protein, partial [Acidobacteria bacterium]|nr:PD40 domain-containing protein [Acidobacteriota bacterium]